MSTKYCALAIEWWLRNQNKFEGATICTSQIEGTDQFIITAWKVDGVEFPTDEEVEQIILDYEAYLESIKYQDKRKTEYPSFTDQLDAIWKGGQDAEDMRLKVLAVKEKYPKP